MSRLYSSSHSSVTVLPYALSTIVALLSVSVRCPTLGRLSRPTTSLGGGESRSASTPCGVLTMGPFRDSLPARRQRPHHGGTSAGRTRYQRYPILNQHAHISGPGFLQPIVAARRTRYALTVPPMTLAVASLNRDAGEAVT